MNSYEEFKELEENAMEFPEALPMIVQQAYERVDEFGNYYRAAFILFRRYANDQRSKKGQKLTFST